MRQLKNGIAFAGLLLVLIGCGSPISELAIGDNLSDSRFALSTFANPIVQPYAGGGSADPSVIRVGGYYYWAKTVGDLAIGVAKSASLQDIGNVPLKTVYTPPAGAYSREIWAPEIQYINGSFYIYFAGDDGNNVNHRMYCIQANSQDPQGAWTFRGKVSASDNKWAIDGLVLQKSDGSLYFVWSGCEVNADFPQNLYIAPMSNPYTISGSKVKISTPTNAWEKNGAAINEGPSIIQKNGTINIVFSASASWLDAYCLGILTCTNGNVLNAASWAKTGPVFTSAATAYGPGHNSFTKSPNGAEDWIVYHADEFSGGGWGNRSVRTQKIGWNGNVPALGTPVGCGAQIALPGGSAAVQYSQFLSSIANNYIRHQDSRGKIASGVSPVMDQYFKVVPGLANTGAVSLESVNCPNRFLRHRNGEIWLDKFDGSALFKSDATWYIRAGLADSTKVSFESYNFPGNYIRHRSGLLYSTTTPAALDKSDATFTRQQ
jgi:GH43 family beta-xylosidase